MFGIERPIDPLTPDPIIWFGSYYHVSNTTLLAVLITIGLALFCAYFVRKIAIEPGKLQTAVEFMFDQLYTLAKGIIGSHKGTAFFFPVIGGLFIFIIISNLIGVIPGLLSITYDGKPIFRPPTSDFSTTFGLALGVLVMIHVLMLGKQGLFGYIGNFIKIKDVFVAIPQGMKAVSMAIIHFLVGLLDIVGEFAKVISLSLRLFGNIYAGQVLATIIFGFFALAVPIVWTLYSSLAGIIQAIVFSALVASYYALGIGSGNDTAPQELSRRE